MSDVEEITEDIEVIDIAEYDDKLSEAKLETPGFSLYRLNNSWVVIDGITGLSVLLN